MGCGKPVVDKVRKDSARVQVKVCETDGAAVTVVNDKSY